MPLRLLPFEQLPTPWTLILFSPVMQFPCFSQGQPQARCKHLNLMLCFFTQIQN